MKGFSRCLTLLLAGSLLLFCLLFVGGCDTREPLLPDAPVPTTTPEEEERFSYKVVGPGVVRAVQEAVLADKAIVFIIDYDSTGYPIRIGYYLVEQELEAEEFEQDPLQPEVTWFSSDEIQIIKGAESNTEL